MASAPARWPQWLPAALAAVAGPALSALLLVTPVTSLPDGTPASGLEAGNPFVVGLALLVFGLSVTAVILAVLDRRRPLWAVAISLLALGSLPLALGPQIWVVGLLVLLSALIPDGGGRDPTRLVATALVLAALAGLIALTVLTASRLPFATAALGVGLLTGALLSAVGALVGRPLSRIGPFVVVALVAVAGLVGAVVVTEAPVATAPSPRVTEFSTSDPVCATDGGHAQSVTRRPGWNRHALTLSAAIPVPDPAYALERPALSSPTRGRYVLTIESRRVDASARDCPALIPYSITLRLPRIHEGGYHVEVLHDGVVVQEAYGRDGSFCSRGSRPVRSAGDVAG